MGWGIIMFRHEEKDIRKKKKKKKRAERYVRVCDFFRDKKTKKKRK
ncbi:hypothetical protein [Lacticaseibacillus rhamnosus]|nr:hypothetical protein [Lacticaseibacillus rhamnosus]